MDSLALANAQLNVQTAYKNFFSGQNDFPTLKSKKNRKSYTTNRVNRNIMLLNGHIKLPKLKLVKIKQHREIPQDHMRLSHVRFLFYSYLFLCLERLKEIFYILISDFCISILSRYLLLLKVNICMYSYLNNR